MLKHLTIEEMLALITPWVKKTSRRITFLSIPEIAGYQGRLALTYHAIQTARPLKPATSPELAALIDELTRLEARHDHLTRAVILALEAQREHCLAQDPADSARALRCDEISAKLLPGGLSIVTSLLPVEPGNTARVANLIQEEPGIADFLKTIPAAAGMSLHDSVERWIEVGAQIEKLERDRAELLAKSAAPPVSKPNLKAARYKWLRLVSQVLSSLEMSDAPPASIEGIRAPILRAAERAAKRYLSGKPEDPVLDPEELQELEGRG
jgi:hypothetical protein